MILALLSCEKMLDPDEAGNLVPKTVEEDNDLPFVIIDNKKVHAETFGDIRNPLIVFLHGGPGGDYRALISEYGKASASPYISEREYTKGGLSQLLENYFCVFYDQMGSGLSPRYDEEALSFGSFIDELDGIINYFLDEKLSLTGQKDSSVTLFAHSFGGVLATGYTNKYPQKISNIVSYEPGPFSKEAMELLNFTLPFALIGEEMLDEHLMSLKHITAGSHARADFQRALGANRFQPEFHENENYPFWRLGASVNNKVSYSGHIFENGSLTDNLTAFEGGFLFVFGELTAGDLSLEYIEKQVAYYPSGTSIVIPGTGHSGVWERADEVARIVNQFLEH
jgi:proline iminopeptidase